ncbi:MAG: YgiW/YdeI family stress tolerance OB fold protein [Deltaproteobacteria bacterium]|nr:YgiW/YdeI family stress tolerance OB fold protein [Deltaproteobacteria bacterium]
MKNISMMILVLAIITFLFYPVDIIAQTSGDSSQSGGFQADTPSVLGGGFQGPGLDVSTVEQALRMSDDSAVILRGNIIQHLGKDNYLFQDGTGSITVDIDDDKWRGVTVKPENLVEIQGEVDKDWNSIEIDVHRIAIVN